MSRGRGRGRGQAFHLQQIGLGPGEAPPAILQPPPLFPSLERNPLPLKSNELDNYLLSVKQEFRTSITHGPFYIKPVDKRIYKIQRYSDRYRKPVKRDRSALNIALIPKELTTTRKSRQLKKAHINSGVTVDHLKEDSEDEESATEELPAEVLYDEEQEEEGDYQLTYFDDGEDYGGDEDDNLDDGPCY